MINLLYYKILNQFLPINIYYYIFIKKNIKKTILLLLLYK